jgi:toxin ParE1/3/4
MNVIFLPAAQEELAVAVAYLEIRAPGLGAELLDDVERISPLASTLPSIGRTLDDIHRRVTLQRFAYHLVYRIRDDATLVVVAVAHKRRRPGYWRTER